MGLSRQIVGASRVREKLDSRVEFAYKVIHDFCAYYARLRRCAPSSVNFMHALIKKFILCAEYAHFKDCESRVYCTRLVG
jgi:hypothetical protein